MANYADMMYGGGGVPVPQAPQPASLPPQPMLPPASNVPPPPNPMDMITQMPPEQLPAPPPGEPSFTDKLRSDPALLQSMLMMGARMMQGPRLGQDAIGSLGDALVVGASTHNFLKENERQAGLDAVEAQRRNALADAQIGQAQATTAGMVQKTAQSAAEFPGLQEKAALEMKKMRTEGDLEGAKLVAYKIKNSPEQLAEELGLAKRKTLADIGQSNAAAGASAASAGANNARRKQIQQETEAERILADPLSNTNRVEGATRMLNKGGAPKTGASASKDRLASLYTIMKTANPDATEQDAAKQILAIETGAKGEQSRIAMSILGDPASYTPETVEAARQTLAEGLRSRSSIPSAKETVGAPSSAPAAKSSTLQPPPQAQRIPGQTKWMGRTWTQENGQFGWK